MTFEKADCRVYVINDVRVAEPGAPRRPWICAIRAVPVIEVRRYAEVSGRGNPIGHPFHELIDSVLVLDQHHCRKRPAAIGLADVKVHRTAIHFDLFTV
jgi:hypothetical protein